jgi:hypothetical protein
MKAVVFDEPTIAARVAELGAEVTAAYPTGDLLLVEDDRLHAAATGPSGNLSGS